MTHKTEVLNAIDSQEKLLGLGLVYDSNNMHKTEISKQVNDCTELVISVPSLSGLVA